MKLGRQQTNAPPQERGIATTDCAKAPTNRGLRPGATGRDPPAGPKARRREAYFFFRVVRFFEARFLAAFFGARFFEARFLVAFLLARFFDERFLAAFFVERFFVERFLAAFLVVRFFAARFLAGRLFFAAFLVRFFAVAISTSSKVGQDCRCTYRIVTSLHVSSGTAHELYISLLHLSEKFCNLGT